MKKDLNQKLDRDDRRWKENKRKDFNKNKKKLNNTTKNEWAKYLEN